MVCLPETAPLSPLVFFGKQPENVKAVLQKMQYVVSLDVNESKTDSLVFCFFNFV